MKAVIMAGGRGTRLAPYTTVLPKPLMPLADRPVIEVVLRQLARDGADGVLISVGHLGSLLESWVTSEVDCGVPVSFVYEDEPLGTAGALRNIPTPEGSFLALNGDILTTLPFAELLNFHASTGAIATMAVKERTVDIEYGVVHADGDGYVAGLEEKPRLSYSVSMGVYAFEPAIVDHIEPGERIDFPDLLLRAIGAGGRVAVYPFEGYWRDIGNRDDYETAIADFAADPGQFLS